MAGDSSNGAKKNPVNPLTPPSVMSTPDWSKIEDPTSWEKIDHTECWVSILNGEYGRDIWPGGKKPIDIHVIYSGGYQNSLNSLPNANAAIEVFRKVDFSLGGESVLRSVAPVLRHRAADRHVVGEGQSCLDEQLGYGVLG